MNRLLDLRFVIGLFFLVVGMLLFAYHFITSAKSEDINLWCGILFTLFGVIMILLSRKNSKAQV